MIKLITAALFILVFIISVFYFNPFRAPGGSEKNEILIIESTEPDAAAVKLEKEGFIKSFTAFSIAQFIKKQKKIEPGGYYLSKNMNSWQVVNELDEGPDFKQITFIEGLRKEQIGEILKAKLGWNDRQLEEWNNVYSENNTDYREGVYFPDTYLIPVNESPTQVANRMIANFNEKFGPYFKEAAEKNIKWTTVVKIASLLEREAAGPSDMPLISGIIWNRLENGQKLDIDATIQYAKGKTNGEWWARVTGSDIRNTYSSYNTYKFNGLPPTPIANPGISAIKAALNPVDTDCLFYLHASGQIYCSVTYKEHLEKIENYLR